MKRYLSAILLLLIASVPLVALGQEEEDEIPTTRLVVHPAGESRAALKYKLLPPLLDRRPGNAVVHYGKANGELAQLFADKDFRDEIYEWLDMPLEELPRKRMREALARIPFKQIERGARSESCDWQLPIHDEPYITMLLPMVQESRSYARLLILKARLHIVEGEFDEAVHTLQTGNALGRHVGQGQTLVNGLVGLAISGMMNSRLEELIQQPDAPNFYWALTALPRPLVDMRPGFEAEMNMFYLSLPELREIDDTQQGLAYWQSVVDRTIDSLEKWPVDQGLPLRLAATILALRGYPQAKRDLIAHGRSAEAVEAMPVPQVVVLHMIETHEEFRDEAFKWFFVPYWQGREGMERAEERLMGEAPSGESIPVDSIMLSSIRSARFAVARSERGIAMLRIVEALRIYAAANDRQWPDRLEQITQVPVPIDPITGKPFIYMRDGKMAVLESRLEKRESHSSKRIEITMAEKP